MLNYFTTYYGTLSLSAARCDALSIFEGVKFVLLDRTTYMKVQTFAGSLEHELFTDIGFSGIEVSTFFMYLDFVVWSSLSQSDTQVLYDHMTKKVSTILLGKVSQAFNGKRGGSLVIKNLFFLHILTERKSMY